ncbi:MAG TPA: hypothetical protein VLC29_03630 [Rhizomicrobium sp.]|jgi:hypothetical protein|nr:hypothetical protein [Rhizomicrobium sp.]
MGLDLYMAAGFAGALLVVVAYLANQMGRLPSDDWRFPGANLAGSVLILASLYSAWNFPSAVIELFWAAISIYGLIRGRRPAAG